MERIKICCISPVAEAAREVRPFGLDLCTGVRSDGQLDEAKLKAFFGALRSVA